MSGPRGDTTDATKKIMRCLKNDRDRVFTPKELGTICRMDARRVNNILARLLRQEKVKRVSRGKYRYSQPGEAPSKEQLKRYFTTLEKTCEIAIHELMLTEPLVGKDDRVEVEHQIAYFARHLVKVRWELNKGSLESMDMDEDIFKRARKIHEWSKFVFEQSRVKKK